MGCSYPIKVKNPNYVAGSVKLWQRNIYYFVPCGKCLGCQIAKRTWLRDAGNFEYNHYGIGSFTTITYDENTVPIDLNSKQMVLNYKDVQDFMKRLRENIRRKYGYRREFKYIAVGELGGQNGRPHYHILFFGLDWASDDKIITESWEKGIVQNLPIKDGAINYVLKYMDKDQIRRRKHYSFDDNQKPFLKHSTGLGKGLIEKQMNFIIEHNGCYLSEKRQLRPIPMYWMRKLKLYQPKEYTWARKEMAYRHIPKKNENYSKNEIETWLYQEKVHKEKLAIEMSRQKQEAQDDFDETYKNLIQHEML